MSAELRLQHLAYVEFQLDFVIRSCRILSLDRIVG